MKSAWQAFLDEVVPEPEMQSRLQEGIAAAIMLNRRADNSSKRSDGDRP